MKSINEKIEELVKAINHSPSADNCQPFDYEVVKNILIVKYNRERAAHPLNRNECASFLSIGFLIKYIELASHTLNLAYSEQSYYDQNLEQETILKYTFREKDDKDIEVKTQISLKDLINRSTNRNTFTRNSDSLIKDVKEFIHQSHFTSSCYYSDNVSNKFLKFIASNESTFLSWKTALKALLRWVYFSKDEVVAHKDGIDYRNIGLNFFELKFLKTIKSNELLLNTFIKLKLYLVTAIKLLINLRNSREYIVFTIRNNSHTELINAGKDICYLWVYLNKLGIQTQPMNASALMYWSFLANNDRDSIPHNLHKKAFEVLPTYKFEFGIKEKEIPIFLLRIGKSSELPSEYRSLRRSCNIKVLGKAPL